MGGKPRRRDEKLEIIEQYLTGHHSISDLSRMHGVPQTTLRQWIVDAGHNIAEFRQQKLEEAADLLASYLVENLRTLNSQAKKLGDEEFLENALPERIQAVGVAHGIMSDKSLRIVEAIERAKAEKEEREARRLALEEGDTSGY